MRPDTQPVYVHNSGSILVATYAPHTTALVARAITLADADSLYEALSIEALSAAKHPERGALPIVTRMMRELRDAMDAAKAWRRAAGWANPFAADAPRSSLQPLEESR